MKHNHLQCKDIPDWPILHFLAHMPEWQPGLPKWGTWFWTDDYQPDNSVLRAMPPGTPPKLALAKMATLIRRGLVNGCTCGCRGDFEITEKGLLILETYGPPPGDLPANFGLPDTIFGIPVVIEQPAPNGPVP